MEVVNLSVVKLMRVLERELRVRTQDNSVCAFNSYTNRHRFCPRKPPAIWRCGKIRLRCGVITATPPTQNKVLTAPVKRVAPSVDQNHFFLLDQTRRIWLCVGERFGPRSQEFVGLPNRCPLALAAASPDTTRPRASSRSNSATL